jgi:2,5-diketo-D-gluconate reductase A
MNMATVSQTIVLHTGTEMPVIGLGTWQLNGGTAAGDVRHALAIGYRLIDTAVDYGTQAQIGEALRSGPVRRDEVFLASKVEEDEGGYAATVQRVQEIGVDRLDLCLIHRPPPGESGETLWRGLMAAKRAGLTREIGVSNYSPAQIDELIAATGEVPVINQIEWSPFGFSPDALGHANRTGVVIQAYSPLTRAQRLDNETLAEIAAAHGKTPAQVLLRWNVQLGTAPVPKASSPKHRQENLEVFDFDLAQTEMRRLGELNEHYSALGSLPYV